MPFWKPGINLKDIIEFSQKKLGNPAKEKSN